MLGVACQRYPSERPTLDRVLVNHRIFEDRLRPADQLGHVEPVETPAVVNMDEVLDPARLVPVVPRFAPGFDFGGPVDKLISLATDVVDDRVDDDLAGADR